MPDVTVIIVTYNSRRFLAGCLGSLGPATEGITAGVIAVDNGSMDGSPDEVVRLAPGAEVIRTEGNIGFAAANNVALRRTSSRHVLLLNPDTVLRPQAVSRLVRFLDEHEDCWAAGPAVLNGDGSLQRTGVAFPSLRNIVSEALFLDRLFPSSRLFGAHRRLYDDPARIQEVEFVQGSCLLVRRAAMDAVGFLCEEYFLYFEETDWCFRMRRAGGKVVRVPDAEVVHFGGEASAHYGKERLLHYHRGLLLFFRRHRSQAAGLTLRALLLLRSVVRLLFWSVLGAVRPAWREKAASSIRGYIGVLPILIRGLRS